MKQYHLGIEEGDVAPYVLLPGDPGRVETISSFWDDAHHIATKREFVTYTGTYKGVAISCTSTGIGAPSTSIAMEELARCGAKTFIRVGTCGTFLDHVNNGDMALFDGAVRLDGASKLYAPIEYPAVAHHECVAASVAAADNLGLPYHVGLTRSADTFYAGHSRPGSSFNDFWQSWWEGGFDDLAQLNVVAAEMEASLVFVLARAWGLRAGGISVVMDNVRHVSVDDGGKFDPDKQIDHSEEYVRNVCQLGCEVIRQLYEKDQEKA